MSEQEKVVSKNSPAESNQSSAKTKPDDDLSDVSASDSELVGDDTKSLRFGKTLMDEKELEWMITNVWWRRLLFACPRMRRFLIQSRMNVWFIGITLAPGFVFLVRNLWRRF
jgi:hypothetical protein